MRDLRALPKAHLHVHLEGAMRPSTLSDLAGRQGIDVPPIRGFGSFSAFVGLYRAAGATLRDHDDLRRLVREVVEDAAADGAVWVEPQTYPGRYAGRIGPAAEIVGVLVEEGRATAQRLGIGFGLMVSPDRVLGAPDAEAMAEIAVSFADRGVTSFGLAGDESVAAPEEFSRAFAMATEAGLLSAPHAGELEGPSSIRGALDALGAHRIGHGVRAVEDPELVRRLVDEGVCLDVCPTSNVMLSVVPGLPDHPLARLLAAGVHCSLNGDDPLLFGPGLLEEYEQARTTLGLDDAALATLARCSIEHSAAPPALKAAGIAGIEAWAASIPGAPPGP